MYRIGLFYLSRFKVLGWMELDRWYLVMHGAFISFVVLQIVASSLAAKGVFVYTVHTIDNISLCDILLNYFQYVRLC